MGDHLILIVVGLFLIVIGINNTKGNINSLHGYHRKRVREEDRIPFGKLVGTGTILVGIGAMINGVLSFLSQTMEMKPLAEVGQIVMIVGIVVGLGISFYGMFKYNKGIF